MKLIKLTEMTLDKGYENGGRDYYVKTYFRTIYINPETICRIRSFCLADKWIEYNKLKSGDYCLIRFISGNQTFSDEIYVYIDEESLIKLLTE